MIPRWTHIIPIEAAMKKRVCTWLIISFCFSSYSEANNYRTTYGFGPDKWSSVWLIERSGFKVEVHNNEQFPLDETWFDVPNAIFNRNATSTTYEFLVKGGFGEGEVIERVGQIINEIEIDAWKISVSQESRIVEHGFRSMQLKYGRDKVTKYCYLSFFDKVADAIGTRSLSYTLSNDLIPDEKCLDDTYDTLANTQFDFAVPILQLKTALKAYTDHQRIIFVDTRETWEFEEARIPGAINIKLREVEDSIDRVKDANLVIAYCVKDFRGYEAARAFRKHGINAAIMKPHGMRGWIEEGLPVAGTRGLPEGEAIAALRELAKQSIQ